MPSKSLKSKAISFPSASKVRRIPPLSIRVTETEKEQIKRNAGSMPISRYAKHVLLKPDTRNRALRLDIAQILAKLGQSGFAPSMTTMADAVRHGALPVTEEVEAAIMKACADIADIKTMLMRLLRIKEH